jgi:hypothetical protein
MINATATQNATSDTATAPTTMGGETGRDLRDRRGVTSRTIERHWLSLFGTPFSIRAHYDADTVAAYEAEYPQKVEQSKSGATPARIKVSAAPGVKVSPVAFEKARYACLLTAFLAPTLASVSTTFMVSHAMSGNGITGAAITIVASATSLLFLWAGVRSYGSIAVVLLTLGFEGFCNAVSVFKWLMADLAYYLNETLGKPSEFLDMVSNFTNSDHKDVATGMAILVAVMICAAQVSALYELKKKGQ